MKLLKKIIYYILPSFVVESLSRAIAGYRLHKYGYDALQIIENVSKEMSFDYWLMFGSLLGAYREHAFIKHDDDIDVAILSEKITKHFVNTMESKGFRLISVKETSDRHYRMATFNYKNVIVDFYGFSFDDLSKTNITGFFSYPLEGKTYAYSKQINKYRCYLIHYKFEGIQFVPFMNITVPVPVNSKYILEGTYGTSFMTPDKSNRGDRSSISEIPPIEKLHASIIDVESLPESND